MTTATSSPAAPSTGLTSGAAPAGTRLVAVVTWGSRAITTIAFLACAFVAVGALSGRWSLLSVTTGSMEPAIPTGAGVVVVPTPIEDVEAGDIIAFGAPGSDVLTVHRVAAVGEADGVPTFQTKGDANPVRDPWVVRVNDDTVPRVVSVSPDLGALTSLLGDRVTRLGIAGLGAVLVLVAGLQTIWSRRAP
jgi:signal peptidase